MHASVETQITILNSRENYYSKLPPKFIKQYVHICQDATELAAPGKQQHCIIHYKN
jgi:hypothetical protein